MNTIEEILTKKRDEICSTCANRKSKENLCNITINSRNEAQCINYKCMTKKCHGCKDENKCFEKERKLC